MALKGHARECQLRLLLFLHFALSPPRTPPPRIIIFYLVPHPYSIIHTYKDWCAPSAYAPTLYPATSSRCCCSHLSPLRHERHPRLVSHIIFPVYHLVPYTLPIHSHFLAITLLSSTLRAADTELDVTHDQVQHLRRLHFLFGTYGRRQSTATTNNGFCSNSHSHIANSTSVRYVARHRCRELVRGSEHPAF